MKSSVLKFVFVLFLVVVESQWLNLYSSIPKENIEKFLDIIANLFSFMAGFIILLYTKASETAIKIDAKSDREFKQYYNYFQKNADEISLMFYSYFISVLLIALYYACDSYWCFKGIELVVLFSLIESIGLPCQYQTIIRGLGEKELKSRNS